jgi:ABC-2 type transport system permease protein
VIRAILLAQFRSTRFFSRGSVIPIIAGVFWYGFWSAVALAGAVAAAVASPEDVQQYLPLALCGVCLYWQFVPLVSASMGAAINLRKLLAYPIPHRKLFLVEVLLRFTTGIEMTLVLAAGAVGLWLNHATQGWAAGLRLVAAFAAFVAFNLLLASGTRSLLERLLTRRRVREWVAFFMAMIWVVPRFMAITGMRPKWLGPAGRALSAVGLPWSSAAHAAFAPGAPHLALLAGFSLLGWTVFAGWFGRAQFERNLRFDPQAAQATLVTGVSGRMGRLAERFYRLPSLLWRDPVAGMVEKELRSLSRTPRFRMVFVMGFTFGIMLWLPMVLGRGRHPTMSRYFLTIVCAYSLTLLGGVTYWNCFGFDRSAALFYFAAPIPMQKVLASKNIAALFFIYAEVAVLSGITLLLRMGIGGWQIVETLVVMGICAVYMLALGNVSSIHYPRALHADRVSAGGSRGGFQGFLFLLYPVALLPVVLAYLARYAFSSQLAFVAILALAAVIAAVLYKISLDSAVAAAASKREILMQELTKGDGPLVS